MGNSQIFCHVTPAPTRSLDPPTSLPGVRRCPFPPTARPSGRLKLLSSNRRRHRPCHPRRCPSIPHDAILGSFTRLRLSTTPPPFILSPCLRSPPSTPMDSFHCRRIDRSSPCSIHCHRRRPHRGDPTVTLSRPPPSSLPERHHKDRWEDLLPSSSIISPPHRWLQTPVRSPHRRGLKGGA
jgi:hypothetical protein